MNISLTKELEQFINEKVTAGKYQSASEVIAEALRLLYERDAAKRHAASRHRHQQTRQAELKAKIRQGIEELNRGEGIDGEEVFAELGTSKK